MKSKKGVFQTLSVILTLGILMAMGIFTYLLITNLWVQDVLPEMENAVLPVINDNGNDSTLRNLITSQKTNISNLGINLDLIFLSVWVGSTIFLFSVAFFTKPISKFEFGTFLFIGVTIILLWLNVVEQLFTWYVQQFILNVFTASETNLPIFTWYLDNYISVVILTLISILLVNQFSNKPEEQTDLGEESFREQSFDEGDFQAQEVELDSQGEIRNV